MDPTLLLRYNYGPNGCLPVKNLTTAHRLYFFKNQEMKREDRCTEFGDYIKTKLNASNAFKYKSIDYRWSYGEKLYKRITDELSKQDELCKQDEGGA